MFHIFGLLTSIQNVKKSYIPVSVDLGLLKKNSRCFTPSNESNGPKS